jgi:hypothetical protein
MKALNESKKKIRGLNGKKEARPKRHVTPDVATHRAKKPRLACIKKQSSVPQRTHRK